MVEYEANFELDQSCYTVEIELKKYFDGAGQVFKETTFLESDWVLDEETSLYSCTITQDKHNLSANSDIIRFYMLENDRYEIALFDYDKTNNTYTLYSETPCSGKITLYGTELN